VLDFTTFFVLVVLPVLVVVLYWKLDFPCSHRLLSAFIQDNTTCSTTDINKHCTSTIVLYYWQSNNVQYSTVGGTCTSSTRRLLSASTLIVLYPLYSVNIQYYDAFHTVFTSLSSNLSELQYSGTYCIKTVQSKFANKQYEYEYSATITSTTSSQGDAVAVH
jgi:hypothetical protein